MRMKRRLIARLLQERLPGIKSHDDYFFRAGFDHILQGVLLEYVPRGVYITNFRFPLFDPAGPSLLYSNRTPGSGFVGKDELSEAALVEHVLSVPELNQSLVAGPIMSLNDFIDYLPRLRNEHARLIHAATLILLRQEDEAREVMDAVDRKQLQPSDTKNYEILFRSLKERSNEALDFLKDAREKNLRAFGCKG